MEEEGEELGALYSGGISPISTLQSFWYRLASVHLHSRSGDEKKHVVVHDRVTSHKILLFRLYNLII